MFEEALKRLKVHPHECMHVGDDIEHDVMGARQVGMKTVWFNMNNRSPEHDALADYVITDLRDSYIFSTTRLTGAPSTKLRG